MTTEPQPLRRVVRNLVLRADGRQINVARKQGQLFVCNSGCCCGLTEQGYAAVPTELYHHEWERRKLRNKVHFTQSGCLGPCTLANVAMLMFDGHSIWFHSVNSERQVRAIYDYIDSMLDADAYLPPPPSLVDYAFQVFDHELEQAHEHGKAPLIQSVPVEQPGILFLGHADTDFLLLDHVIPRLPKDFPPITSYQLSNFRTAADIDAMLARDLPAADVIILRLHGGRSSFLEGFDRLVELCRAEDKFLLCLPGTDSMDIELTTASTVSAPVLHEMFSYLQYGGPSNMENGLRFLADHLLLGGFGFERPAPQPREGVYRRTEPAIEGQPTIGILFYRSHLLAANLEFVDSLCDEFEQQSANVIAVYAYSLRDIDENGRPKALEFLRDVEVIISTMSFAMGKVNPDGPTLSGWSVDALSELDVPVIQAVTAGSSREQWEASLRGLTPLDVAMNVALPEFDGRIDGPPISFKETSPGKSVVRYVPVPDRIKRTVEMALRLAVLRSKPNSEKKVAFVFTNSPTKAARIGNAVGLDAPASLLRMLDAMKHAGYRIEGVPEESDELLHTLIDRCSYDTEFLTEEQLSNAAGLVPSATYARWHAELPEQNRREIDERWGEAPGKAYFHNGSIALAGLDFGNVFVALQPPRGYGMDPNLIYHVPDLPPPHNYHALYRWLQDPEGFGADAIVHVGKHGTLEWLPGKGAGMSETCFPDQFLGGIPLIYPFIINDPGEGTQAKRRAHAIIVDHMTPPMTEAGAYGELAELTQLVDEYYQVEQMDPGKLPLLQTQIWDLIKKNNLDSDIQTLLNYDANGPNHTHEWDDELSPEGSPVSLADMRGKDFAHLIENIDAYLCELTGAQIRDGLHTLGFVPDGEQLVDLIAHLVRVPNLEIPSLRASLTSFVGLDLKVIQDALGSRLKDVPERLALLCNRPLVTNADALIEIDRLLKAVLSELEAGGFARGSARAALETVVGTSDGPAERDALRTLEFICGSLVPNLRRNTEEIENILRALDGRYVPAGPSGAPSRGMAHVLPTGRNFYGVDPVAVPSLSAWRVGSQLAVEVLEKHLQEEGSYPESVGISIWGTSAMRTHGDDVAEAFALMGIRPVWQEENRRVIGVEAIPLAELGRPRIDVVCRISGFFRDAFPHLIGLLDEAVRIAADLDEPLEDNFIRKHVLEDESRRKVAGEDSESATRSARYRVFGSKPGSYGAGILPLIDEHNWRDETDFARVYLEWGGYAYTSAGYGVEAKDTFANALAGVTVAIKNQDNREHDIFDSDDYMQFHGGMIATVRALTGRGPKAYFGDSSDPGRARVRDLKDEAKRVFRSRVVNPKWIASIKRHGFKGALELAATVDYLFGYDATSNVVDDWMYERLAASYLFDQDTREFLEKSNPWALRGMAERLMEAMSRGLWEQPNAETRRRLQSIYLASEGALEARQEPAKVKV